MAWFDLDAKTTAAIEDPEDEFVPVETFSRGLPSPSAPPPEPEEDVIVSEEDFFRKGRILGRILNPTPERSLSEELGVGIDRGIDQTQGLGYGFVGLLGQAVGLEGVEEYGVENYLRKMEEAAMNEASVRDPFEEIDDLGDAGLYAAGIIGEQIPQLLASALGGGIGGVAAKTIGKRIVGNMIGKRVAAGMARDEAAKEVAKETAGTLLGNAGRAGGVSGAYLANFGQISGGSFGQMAQELGRGDAGIAAGFAVGGAALDTLGEVFIASKFLKPFSKTQRAAVDGVDTSLSLGRVGGGAATGFAAGSAIEGGTEYVQTGLEQAALGAADPNRTIEDVVMTPEAGRERLIAAAAGATVGAPLGGVGGAFEVAFSPRTTEELNRKARQTQTTQQQQTETTPAILTTEGWEEPVTVGENIRIARSRNGLFAGIDLPEDLASDFQTVTDENGRRISLLVDDLEVGEKTATLIQDARMAYAQKANLLPQREFDFVSGLPKEESAGDYNPPTEEAEPAAGQPDPGTREVGNDDLGIITPQPTGTPPGTGPTGGQAEFTFEAATSAPLPSRSPGTTEQRSEPATAGTGILPVEAAAGNTLGQLEQKLRATWPTFTEDQKGEVVQALRDKISATAPIAVPPQQTPAAPSIKGELDPDTRDTKQATRASETLSRPVETVAPFVESLKEGDRVSVAMPNARNRKAKMVPAVFAQRLENGDAVFQLEDGKSVMIPPEKFNRVGMFRPEDTKTAPVAKVTKEQLGPTPTKAKIEQTFGVQNYKPGQTLKQTVTDGNGDAPVPVLTRLLKKKGSENDYLVETEGEFTNDPLASVRQMNAGLPIYLPENQDLNLLSPDIEVTPVEVAGGGTRNKVTAVNLWGRTYRQGAEPSDFSVSRAPDGGMSQGETRGLGVFNSIYRLSPERMRRSAAGMQAARTREQAKRMKPEELAAGLNNLDPVDQAILEDGAQRALAYINRKTSTKGQATTDETRDAARDLATDNIMIDVVKAASARKDKLPAASVPVARRVISAFNDLLTRPLAAGQRRDTQAEAQRAGESVVGELVAAGSTEVEARAAVAPIISRVSAISSPISAAEDALKSATKTAIRTEANQAAATVDLAEGTVGEAAAPKPASGRAKAPSRAEAAKIETMTERKARLTEEDKDLVQAMLAGEELRGPDVARVEEIEAYLSGSKTYEEIYTEAQRAGRPELSDPVRGRTAGREVSGTTESRAGRTDGSRSTRGAVGVGGPNRTGSGTVPGVPAQQDGGSGVRVSAGLTPAEQRARALGARRFLIQRYLRLTDEEANAATEGQLDRAYDAIGNVLSPTAANQGRRAVAATKAQQVADLADARPEDLLAGVAQERAEALRNRQRTENVRRLAAEMFRGGAFDSTRNLLEFIANTKSLPRDMQLRAKSALGLQSRGFNWNNVATQIGIFRNRDGSRTTWAGLLGKDRDGGKSIAINLDNGHDRGTTYQTFLHEIQHVLNDAKWDAYYGLPGGQNLKLNKTELAAIKRVENFWKRAVKAAAGEREITFPDSPTDADYARIGEELYALSDPSLEADADRRMAALRNPRELSVEITSSPEVAELLAELGFGKADKDGKVAVKGAIKEAWDALVQLEAGTVADAGSPLAMAFKDAMAINFADTGNKKVDARYTVPGSEPSALTRELDEMRTVSDFIEAELERRGLPGTSEQRAAILEEYEVTRREPTDSELDTVGDPETMSRAAAMEFVSPNDAEGDLTFDQARAALTAPQQGQLRAYAAKVHEFFGLGESTVTDAIGDWADGAEPTTLTEHYNPDLTYQDVEVMAALKGAIRNQKAVIPFLVDDNGSSFIYDFFIPNQTAAQARDILGQAGIEFRTLIEQNGGIRVLVFDKDGSIEAAFTELVQNNNYAGTYYKGTGDFLGSWDSRQEGREIYARTVGRRVDQIRLEEREQGTQGAESLRASRLSELAAEAGLTLTESRATTTPTNENRDTYFGNESSISRGPQEGGQDPSRPNRESQRIARSVYEAGGAIRDAALGVLEEEGLVRRGISLRTEKEIRTISRAIARYLVFSEEQLNAAKTPGERALADAVRSFREKVPLIPKARIEELTTSEADPLAVLDAALDRFEAGVIPEDRFGLALGELARRYGVTIGPDLDAAVATLRDYFENSPSAGATWVLEGEGAESKAYKDDNDVVYKVSPVREDLLSTAPIGRGGLTITARQAPFFDRDGRMPIFDRLLAANGLQIHTPTEIIGFVDDGRIVIKQPYLEKVEPEAGELVTRAKNSGIAVLPAQKEDPNFGGDINTTPLVFRIDGEPWLALDFNPRNSRRVNGTAIPFDLIFRKLTDKDIATNEDIKQAVNALPEGTESRAVAAIKDGELRGFRERARHLLPEERVKLRSDTKKTFIDLFNKLPSEKEFAAVALGGRAKRGWYRASTEAIISVFGLDAPRFAALLAALSPQTSVENNLINALNTWKNWVLAGRPTDRASIISVMGNSVMGSKGEDSVLDAWINNSVRALTAEDPTEIVLSGPKVNSFMLNLRGFVNEVTNDAWMANFALVDQTIFSGSLNVAGTDPGKRPGYLAMSARVRAAADYLTRLTGETWTPAEVQETVWSWAKTLYELQDRKGERRDALEILRAGELTDDAIAATPDFATLLADGQYRQILEEAGYGEAVGQLAGRDPDPAGIGQSESERQASAAASEAVRRGQERAARRLTELYRQRQADRTTESRATGRVWQERVRVTPTGGTISQGGMFAVDELLDKRAGDAYRSSRMAIKADVSVIQELSRLLERQMKSIYRGQEAPRETINTALGNLENPLTSQQLDEIESLFNSRRPKQGAKKRDQYIRENRKRFREETQPAALAQLPEEIAATVREMSSHIESLSKRLPNEGLVSGDLAITVDEALGTYLNRSYAIFDDPKWSDSVRKNAKVMDAARKFIRNGLIQSKTADLIDDAAAEGRMLSLADAKIMANESVTDPDIEAMLEGYLAVGDEAPSIEILSGRIPGQKNLSMFNRRGNIAPEIQALWGRYEDPTVNYAKTVMKLSSVIANNQFLTEIRNTGLQEGWLWSRENNPDDLRQPPGYVRISTDNNPALAPLGGMYAHPMLAEGLFKMFPVGSTDQHYWWLRSAMKLTGVSMAMKTVGSLASQIRNYLGNYLNLIATGNLGLGDIASGDFGKRFTNSTDTILANTFNKYRNATRAEWRAKIDDYIRRGIVGESVTTGLLEDMLTASRKAGSPDFGDVVWSKVSEPFKKVVDLATKTYSAGDDWFKVMIYEAEQDKYRKAFPEWDDNKVKEKAAAVARDIHWTYSLAPAIVQDLKKFPFIAPFVTFTTEVIRTTYNLQKLARQEIMEGRATGNKELEAMGWKRVRGMTTAAFLPAAAGATTMALAGISGEDEEDLRRFLPDWQKNNQLMLFRKENGEVSFLDVSFLDPYEYFKKPLNAFMRSLREADSADEILLGGTMAMVRQALDPFTSEQIFAGAIMDVMRNQDASGRQVYNPQDTGANIGTAVARKIFIEPFTPGTFTSLDRIGKAAFGVQSESGRAYGLFNELASVMAGQRVSQMDAQQALQFKGSRFMREMRDASALFNREFVSQGTRSAGDVVSGYDRSNGARRALVGSIRKDYLAAIRLGVPVARAKAILRDAGIGRETLRMATTGIYKPFEASEDSLKLVRARGNRDRITAYNQARRATPAKEVLP